MHKKKLWVISTNMGYGHQRAAYALKDLAHDRIITANDDDIISLEEQQKWRQMQHSYENLSRLSTMPFFGKVLFNFYDKLQEIAPLYPFRDLSMPNFGARYVKRLITRGIGQSLLSFIQQHKPHHPILTTFYVPALAAHYANYHPTYCVVTDTDINRIWVPLEPKKSKITYFVPTGRTAKRLRSYGVREENIFLTGFPLPKELVGKRDEVMHKDFGNRIVNLDKRHYYANLLHRMRGFRFPTKEHHPLTFSFVLGGAGAQQHILYQIISSLKEKIKKKELRFRVFFGTHLEDAAEFEHFLKKIGLNVSEYMQVQVSVNLTKYFAEFIEWMHETDILFTKPSEMSFYAALGIPIVCLPPIGAHEKYNLNWLSNKGCVVQLEDPTSVDEWLFDLIDQGVLAKCAIDGYFFAEHRGTYNIEEYFKKKYKADVD